ncbi:EAL domain-containing protein [Cellulomonas carbonis]|uniref:EAL domain-containing protein n=1 Tax=Cellulomonas carbonis TaxID=1386092 RepID=UPI000694B1F9|nr:EAL domain-containing protein [Cellulomonas carbonis]GGB92083.1 hypothetical protein GCM10010972_00930 [Cellulomonas carbonis]
MASPGRGDLERFFALSLDLLCVVDAAGRFVHLNEAWATTLDRPVPTLVGRRVLDLVHPDDVDATRDVLAGMAAGERFAGFENRYQDARGGWRDLVWSAWADPSTGLCYGIARDVTEARRREGERREVHDAVLAVSSAGTYAATVSAVAEQVRRVTRALGVVASAAPPTVVGWAGTDVRPYRATAGAPDVTVPPVDLPLLGRDRQPLGRVAVWLPTGLDDAERARRVVLLHEVAGAAALILERSRAELSAELAAARTRELLDSASDAFYALDRHWRFTFVNPAAERLLRRPAGELLGASIWDEFPETVGSSFERGYREAVATGRPVAFIEYYAPLEGWFDVRARPSGNGLSVYFLDVTASHTAARALERRADQQRAVAELGREAVTATDPRTLTTATVEQVRRVLRPPLAGVVRLDGARVLLDAAAGPLAEGLPPALDLDGVRGTALFGALTSGVATAVARIPGPDDVQRGPVLPLGLRSDAAVPVIVGGLVHGAVFVAATDDDAFPTDDVVFLQQLAHVLGAAVERHDAEERLRELAEHDALTRLPNRVVLRREVDAAIATALEDGSSTALLLLDLDGFKDVNDSLGHHAGDLLLEVLGGRLHVVVGDAGTVGRLGGDEFAVCLPGPLADDALTIVAESLLAAVEEPVRLDGLDITLSASMGAAVAPAHGTDASTLLRHADVAMYRAKRTSGGHWVVYDPTVDAAPAERLTLITELRAGIRNGELEVHYQPVVDMASGAPVSLEALVRWRHPARGLVPPDQFVPLAEQTGLIGELTLCVVRHATALAERLRALGVALPIAVNVSVASLTDRESAETLVDELARAAGVLSVEVTESALVERRARAVLQRLASAGVTCAVDDFGTGYSALAYLRSLPVSTLKIDRAFVAEVEDGDVDLAIIRSVVDLAGSLGLDVIAEGVESQPVAVRLAEVGVHHAQGFHYAPPVDGEHLVDWLTARAAG